MVLLSFCNILVWFCSIYIRTRAKDLWKRAIVHLYLVSSISSRHHLLYLLFSSKLKTSFSESRPPAKDRKVVTPSLDAMGVIPTQVVEAEVTDLHVLISKRKWWLVILDFTCNIELMLGCSSNRLNYSLIVWKRY